MPDFSDEEIAADENNITNKIACSTEGTIDKLTTVGFTKREMTMFEAQLRGTFETINFF